MPVRSWFSSGDMIFSI